MSERIRIRLSDDAAEKLDTLAAARGLKPSKLVEALILKEWERDEHMRDLEKELPCTLGQDARGFDVDAIADDERLVSLGEAAAAADGARRRGECSGPPDRSIAHADLHVARAVAEPERD